MTEAVILELIALIGLIIILIFITIMVVLASKTKASRFYFEFDLGKFEINYDHKADKL